MARAPRTLSEKLKAHNPKLRAKPQAHDSTYPASAISGIGGDGADNPKGGAMKTTTPPKSTPLARQQVAPFIASVGPRRGRG